MKYKFNLIIGLLCVVAFLIDKFRNSINGLSWAMVIGGLINLIFWVILNSYNNRKVNP